VTVYDTHKNKIIEKELLLLLILSY